ncbi:MAG: hypothetical protein J6M02_05780 [Clostridia bacterium]|nr:hypothetical protein [Clostridia bacterium]
MLNLVMIFGLFVGCVVLTCLVERKQLKSCKWRILFVWIAFVFCTFVAMLDIVLRPIHVETLQVLEEERYVFDTFELSFKNYGAKFEGMTTEGKTISKSLFQCGGVYGESATMIVHPVIVEKTYFLRGKIQEREETYEIFIGSGE